MTNAAAPAPVLFVSHGSPMVALESGEYQRALASFALDRPRPVAVVVISAHAERALPVRVSSSSQPATIHDFGGFPQALHQISYPAPGQPELAARVATDLSGAGIRAQLDPNAGLDHGAWVPLRLLFPAADLPVVAVSLPVPRSPESLLGLGAALAPLRKEGVLVLGSGGVVHNLRRVRFAERDAVIDPWAREFDDWVAERLADGDRSGLTSYASRAPRSAMAVPTTEHFDPIFVAVGATLPGDRLVSVFTGFEYGNLSMRCFALE